MMPASETLEAKPTLLERATHLWGDAKQWEAIAASELQPEVIHLILLSERFQIGQGLPTDAANMLEVAQRWKDLGFEGQKQRAQAVMTAFTSERGIPPNFNWVAFLDIKPAREKHNVSNPEVTLDLWEQMKKYWTEAQVQKIVSSRLMPEVIDLFLLAKQFNIVHRLPRHAPVMLEVANKWRDIGPAGQRSHIQELAKLSELSELFRDSDSRTQLDPFVEFSWSKFFDVHAPFTPDLFNYPQLTEAQVKKLFEPKSDKKAVYDILDK